MFYIFVFSTVNLKSVKLITALERDGCKELTFDMPSSKFHFCFSLGIGTKFTYC